MSGVAVGQSVRLRKAHPCGSRDWAVVRVGADIGLVCAGCGRKIFLDRETFEKRLQPGGRTEGLGDA